jgi:predicted ATP-grasp superfamily ATP-dependent carboligase
MKVDALVLNAGLRQSLVTVRSLGQRGLNVMAAETKHDVPTFSSRWCREHVVLSAPEGTDAYFRELEALLWASPARVVITSHDGTIALLRRHRADAQCLSSFALASESSLSVAVSKERTLEVARRLGMHTPISVMVHSPGVVRDALTETGLPAVIKPDESWLSPADSAAAGTSTGFWAGPELVTTLDEAEHAVARFTAHGGTAVCQQYLTGRREAVSFFYVRGTVHARFAQWASRTFPPLGGESVVRQSIVPPADIVDRAEAFIREIELEGYSEVEFRRDAAAVPYLMEVNPRLSASVEIAVRSGVDFPYLLYCWAAGERVPVVKSYSVGAWMRHLGGDIRFTIESIQARGRPEGSPPLRTLIDFGTGFFRPMRYDYVDGADPLPAVAATAYFIRDQMRRTASRIRRSFA